MLARSCAGSAGTCRARGRPRPRAVRAMAGTLAHRGPDGEGLHLDGPIALGHRRLSIIDLSEAASEPMTNEDGSLWLIFNGEIYNFREIRRGLEARHRFRSRSDGEVILHLYEEQGDAAVAALDGMFAFALWDARQRRLLLARDRAGKKPLFYHDGAEGLRVRVGDEGAPRPPGRAARAGPRGPAALPDLRLRADAGHVLPRHPGAAAGAFDGGHRGRGRGAEEVLASAVRRAARDGRRWRRNGGGIDRHVRGWHDRRRSRGALPLAASGGRRAASRGRRPARRLPLRRPRLLDGRGAHGGDGRGPREDVHDRLRRPRGVRRAGPRARGGGALLDRAHGVRGRAEGARPRRSPRLAPRRALRRLVGGADVPALGADADEGDGGPQRRRGRRGVRGLPAPLRRCSLGAGAARGVPSGGGAPGPPAGARRPQAPAALRQALRRGGEPAAPGALPALERVLHGGPPGAAEAGAGGRPRPRAAPRELPSELRRGRAARPSPGSSSSTSRPTSSTTCS